MTVHYEFAGRGEMPPVKMSWYDGGLMPTRPDMLPDDLVLDRAGGGILIGTKGIIPVWHLWQQLTPVPNLPQPRRRESPAVDQESHGLARAALGECDHEESGAEQRSRIRREAQRNHADRCPAGHRPAAASSSSVRTPSRRVPTCRFRDSAGSRAGRRSRVVRQTSSDIPQRWSHPAFAGATMRRRCARAAGTAATRVLRCIQGLTAE